MEIIILCVFLSLKMFLSKEKYISFRGLSLLVLVFCLIIEEMNNYQSVGRLSFDLKTLLIMMCLPISLKGYSIFSANRGNS